MIKASEVFEKFNQKSAIENCLKEIESLIIKAAECGETQIKYRNFGFGGGNLYSSAPTKPQTDVILKLNEAGYKTQIQIEERSFVDIWLEIDWMATS